MQSNPAMRWLPEQPLVFQGNVVELDHLFPTNSFFFDHFRKCVGIAHLYIEAKVLKLLLGTKAFSCLRKGIVESRDASGWRFARRQEGVPELCIDVRQANLGH